MGTARPLHRVTIGRTREVRGPDAIERAFAGLTIAVVTAIAVWFGMHLVRIVQTVEAVVLATGPKNNEIVYRAVHGAWPSPHDATIVGKNDKGRYITDVTLGQGGVITTELTLRPAWATAPIHPARDARVIHGFLSFRPALLGSRDAPSIAFLCGYAKPVVRPLTPLATNRTTIDRKYLPAFCR